jgi:hypothetical protein
MLQSTPGNTTWIATSILMGQTSSLLRWQLVGWKFVTLLAQYSCQEVIADSVLISVSFKFQLMVKQAAQVCPFLGYLLTLMQ